MTDYAYSARMAREREAAYQGTPLREEETGEWLSDPDDGDDGDNGFCWCHDKPVCPDEWDYADDVYERAVGEGRIG